MTYRIVMIIVMIPRIIIYPEAIEETTIQLDSELHHYLKHVLRLNIGDTLTVTVHKICTIQAKIVDIRKTCLLINVIEKTDIIPFKGVELTVIQSLVKGDKLSTVLNTCTQAGAAAFQVVETERSVARIRNWEHKQKRLKDVLYSASLQSQRSDIPTLGEALTFEDFLRQFNANTFDYCLLAWEEETVNTLKHTLSSFKKTKIYCIIHRTRGRPYKY